MIPELLPEGKFINPLRASVFSMAVNTKLVPAAEEPTVWADLLHPRFKGKMASDDPRGSGGGAGLVASLEKPSARSICKSWRPKESSSARIQGRFWPIWCAVNMYCLLRPLTMKS